MATKKSKENLSLLKTAREQIISLTKPTAQREFRSTLARIDKQAERLTAQARAGKLPRRIAARALAQFKKTRREVVRLMSAHQATAKSALTVLNQQIKLGRGNR